MIDDFHDDEAGGFFYISPHHETLIARHKDYFDGSVPSGNSMAAYALLRLGKLTGSERFALVAAGTIESCKGMLQKHPAGVGQMFLAANMQLGPAPEVVFTTSNHDAAPQAISLAYQNFLPNHVVAVLQGNQTSIHLQELFAGKELHDQPQMYVCENFACQAPVSGLSDISEKLQKMGRPLGS